MYICTYVHMYMSGSRGEEARVPAEANSSKSTTCIRTDCASSVARAPALARLARAAHAHEALAYTIAY